MPLARDNEMIHSRKRETLTCGFSNFSNASVGVIFHMHTAPELMLMKFQQSARRSEEGEEIEEKICCSRSFLFAESAQKTRLHQMCIKQVLSSLSDSTL